MLINEIYGQFGAMNSALPQVAGMCHKWVFWEPMPRFTAGTPWLVIYSNRLGRVPGDSNHVTVTFSFEVMRARGSGYSLFEAIPVQIIFLLNPGSDARFLHI